MSAFDITEGAVLFTNQGQFRHQVRFVLAPLPPPVESMVEERKCPTCGKVIGRKDYWAAVPMYPSSDLWPKHTCSRRCAEVLVEVAHQIDMEQEREESDLAHRHAQELEQLRRTHGEKRRKLMLGQLKGQL